MEISTKLAKTPDMDRAFPGWPRLRSCHRRGAYLYIAISLIALSACSGNTESNDSGASALNSRAECTEPENPWAGEEGGHEAGFTWAQENGAECSSDRGLAFEEGCNEYYDQLHRYESCKAHRKN